MRTWFGPLCATVLAALLAFQSFDPRPETWDDNAEFLVLAQSLATGQGYATVNEPHPQPNARLLPAWPAMLALANMLGVDDLHGYKALVAVLFVLLHLALYSLLARWCPPPWSFIGAAWSASHFLLLPMSSQTMSEVPYSLLAVAALWLVEGPVPLSRRRLAALSGLACLAVMTRGFGLAVVGAVVLTLLARGQGRQSLTVAVVVAAGAVPWIARVRWIGTLSYGDQFWMVDPYRPELGSIDLAGLVSRMSANARILGTTTVPFAVTGWSSPDGLWMATVALMPLALLFARWSLRTRHVAPLTYAGLSLMILLVWPTVWCNLRMLVPLVPMVPVALLAPWYRGVTDLGLDSSLSRQRWIGWALAALLASSLPHHVKLTDQLGFGRPDAAFTDFVNVALWAREHLAPGCVVASRRPFTLHVVSGHRTVLRFAPDLGSMWAALEAAGATHLLSSRLGLPREEELGALVRANPTRVRLLHRIGDQGLYAIIPVGSGGAPQGP